MINEKSILALILARGGSKGIPNKNIKELNGKPLLAYTINAANKSRYLDRIILSTDDDKIAEIGKKYGAEVPFKRPNNLATDKASSIDAIIHAINWLDQNEEYKPDYTMLLQPTSPLRTVEDIDNSLEKLINNKGDSLVALSKAEKHPYWMMKINKGLVEPFSEKKEQYSCRQDLPNIYEINGSIYIAKTRLILEEKTLQPSITLSYIMPKEKAVDIDNMLDWKLVELLLREDEK